jgi:hypothetical protein
MPWDPIFDRWAEHGLTWLPEHGMGRLRVDDAPYDVAYFRKYQSYAKTAMGAALTEARVSLVNRYTDEHVIDVGVGSGAFVQARGGWTWGYDVNPEGVRWLQEHARWRDPYEGGPHNALCFWDVLEHIAEPARILSNVRRYVFVSLPIVPGDGPPHPEWKHFRRDEHCWYWTRHGFETWMGAHGFAKRLYSDMETLLGREDIGTFVFERVT